jgi:hypothetical protein
MRRALLLLIPLALGIWWVSLGGRPLVVFYFDVPVSYTPYCNCDWWWNETSRSLYYACHIRYEGRGSAYALGGAQFPLSVWRPNPSVYVEVIAGGDVFPAPNCTAEPRQWLVVVHVYGCTPLAIRIGSNVYTRSPVGEFVFWTDKKIDRAAGGVLCLLG